VVEQTLRLEDLYTADEVFISSTNRNVIGVKEIGGREVGGGKAGPMTKKLDGVFEAYINDYIERRLAASR
jgi:branched-subunit amino acid aminotransferase/4-amino-4-deoxychorismate lyase